jgi:hypothetical protein
MGPDVMKPEDTVPAVRRMTRPEWEAELVERRRRDALYAELDRKLRAISLRDEVLEALESAQAGPALSLPAVEDLDKAARAAYRAMALRVAR